MVGNGTTDTVAPAEAAISDAAAGAEVEREGGGISGEDEEAVIRDGSE